MPFFAKSASTALEEPRGLMKPFSRAKVTRNAGPCVANLLVTPKARPASSGLRLCPLSSRGAKRQDTVKVFRKLQ
jgi:hypothetical protein